MYLISENEIKELCHKLDAEIYWGNNDIPKLVKKFLKSKQSVELMNDIYFVDGVSAICSGALEKLYLKIPRNFHNKPFKLAIVEIKE